MKNRETPAHDARFDLLRILAMLIVILFHYTTQFSASVMQTNFALFFPSELVRFAISLFLLMVGYFSLRSVTSAELSAGKYLKKRLLRLMPTFWLCLIITSAVLMLTKTELITVKRFALNALLINRFFGVPFVDGVYWYMLILGVFTAFLTLAKLLRRPARRTALYIAYTAAFLLCGVIHRFIRPFPTVISFALFEYINRCLIGLLIAYVYKNQKTAAVRQLAAAGTLILALLLGEIFWCTLSDFLIDLGTLLFFLLVVFFGGFLRLDGKRSALVQTVALESFFIYLIHQRLGFLVLKWLIDRGVNCNLSVFFAILFVAVLAYLHYLLRSLLAKRRSGTV